MKIKLTLQARRSVTLSVDESMNNWLYALNASMIHSNFLGKNI